MKAATGRRRAAARGSVEVVLEHPALNRSASLGVLAGVWLDAWQLRAGDPGRAEERLCRHADGWHLADKRAAQLGIPAGPWPRLCLRSPTGRSILRVEVDA